MTRPTTASLTSSRLFAAALALAVAGACGDAEAPARSRDGAVGAAPAPDGPAPAPASPRDARTAPGDGPTGASDGARDLVDAPDGGPARGGSANTPGPATCGATPCGPDEICVRPCCQGAGCSPAPPHCVARPAPCGRANACTCFEEEPCGGAAAGGTCREVSAAEVTCRCG